MSYQASVYDAVTNAGRLMKEGRANAVKLEGGAAVCEQIRAIVDAGIRSVRIWALRRSRSTHSAVTRCKANRPKQLVRS